MADAGSGTDTVGTRQLESSVIVDDRRRMPPKARDVLLNTKVPGMSGYGIVMENPWKLSRQRGMLGVVQGGGFNGGVIDSNVLDLPQP